MKLKPLLFLAQLACALIACGDSPAPSDAPQADAGSEVDAAEPAQAAPTPAPLPAPDWQLRTPEQVGLRKEGLDAALDYAFQAGKHTQGVVIIRHRALVAERYEAGRDANSFGASWSVGKSFASALVGIAIDRGLIANVDVAMSDYYPEWKSTPKEKIHLRDVLQMASGLKWVEDYRPSDTSAGSDIVQMVLTPDELPYAVSREASNAPGTVFNYSSGDSMLISGVLARATGMSALEFGKQALFDKIGMAPLDWWRDTQGHTLTYCCIDTPTRQFAKFGLLFLERGKWDGAAGDLRALDRRIAQPLAQLYRLRLPLVAARPHEHKAARRYLRRQRRGRPAHLRNPEPRLGRGAQRPLRQARGRGGRRSLPVRALPELRFGRRRRHDPA